MQRFLAVLATGMFLACSGSKTPPTSPPPSDQSTSSSSSSAAPTAATPAAAPEAPAHKLVVLANACWFGGLWADAEREPSVERKPLVETRCREVLQKVYGPTSDDKGHLEQLRGFDGGTVGDLAAKVETLAATDPKEAPRKAVFSTLVMATAAAQREAAEARRAAERVKRDLDHEPDKLTKDEADAVGALSTTKDIEALFALDAGDLSPDAHALALITAMDRIALSRGLPKHLKVYALSGTFKALFGVTPPADMPTDATKPLKKGMYLAYVTDAAKAAGHAVPDTAKTVREKESLAWSGTLQGVADKINTNAQTLSPDTELHEVSLRIANRLTAWNDAEQKAVVAVEKSKGDKPATAKPDNKKK